MPKISHTEKVIKSVKTFESVRKDARKNRSDFSERYSWNENNDIRLGVFEQIDNLIRSFTLSTVLSLRGMSDTHWINHQLFRSLQLTEEEKKKQFQAVQINLHNFHRISYIYTLMQVIEGTIRSIARKIISNEDGTGSFGNICKKIHQKLAQPEKVSPEMRNALDLLREIRNTIHNNGFYYPNDENKKAWEIEYKGNVYTFSYGNPHTHATYAVLAEISRDIITFFKVLVEDSEIAKIEQIEGASGNVFDRIIS